MNQRHSDYLVRHITLRQLQLFEAIARLGSFSKAADDLFLTQPTVSMQIKKLTQAVGMPLFEQVGRQVYLTAAGKHVYETAKIILSSLENIEMKLASLRGLKQGYLSLAVVTTAEYFIPRLLGKFYQMFPGLEIILKVTNREHIIERMASNADDLYIIGQPPEDNVVIHAVPFASNPLVVIAPPDHFLANEKNISLTRLLNEPFIIREIGSGLRKSLERLFEIHNIKPNICMELGSNEAIKQTIIGGLGISVLSLHTVVQEILHQQLVVLDVEHFPIEKQWYLAYLQGKELSIASETFFNFLKNEGGIVNEHLQKVMQTLKRENI